MHAAAPRRSTLNATAIAALVVTLASFAGAASAQQQLNRFELSPQFGLQFQGEYEFDDVDFGYTRIEVDSSETFGVTFDIPVSRSLSVELFAARQETELEITEGVGQLADPDVTFDFYHVGIQWQPPLGQVKPFFVATVGATKIDPGITEIDTEYQPSLSVGGGVKLMFSENLGLRLEGRLMVTSLDDGFDDGYDDYRCCRRRDYDNDNIAQGRVAAGLVFAF